MRTSQKLSLEICRGKEREREKFMPSCIIIMIIMMWQIDRQYRKSSCHGWAPPHCSSVTESTPGARRLHYYLAHNCGRFINERQLASLSFGSSATRRQGRAMRRPSSLLLLLMMIRPLDGGNLALSNSDVRNHPALKCARRQFLKRKAIGEGKCLGDG